MIKKFVDITQYIQKDFNNKKDQNIIFFFIDSCGWKHFQHNKTSLESIKNIFQDGKILKIKSQFPSITQCHITSAHLGIPVSETGILSEKFYNEKLDKRVELFKLTSYQEANIDKLIPFQSFYEKLKEINVNSAIFLPNYLNGDPLALKFTAGGSVKFSNFEKNLDLLNEKISKSNKNKYYFFYNSDVDSSCHHNGPYSYKTMTIYQSVFEKLNKMLKNLTPKIKTTVIIASDHGQINIDMSKTIIVKHDLPEIEQYFRKNNNCEVILPGGSFREIHFYLNQKNNIHIVKEKLSEKYNDTCNIYTKQNFIYKFWNGTYVSKETLNALGDVILIANKKNTFTWNCEIPKWKGVHGGNSDDEMYTACLIGTLMPKP